MNPDKPAEIHRKIGLAQHAAEERMLAGAATTSRPDETRERAHLMSADADEHLAEAARLQP